MSEKDIVKLQKLDDSDLEDITGGIEYSALKKPDLSEAQKNLRGPCTSQTSRSSNPTRR